MSIENFNNKIFSVIRIDDSDDFKEVWRKIGEIEGFFQQTTGKEAFFKQQQFENTALIGFLDINTDIKVGDRLQDYDNCYRVTSVVDSGGVGHHLEVYLELSTEYIEGL